MPITKQTVAIIGSSHLIGNSIANALCKDNYRLLLFEENSEEAESLSETICSSVDGADVEFSDCTHQACWEADVILILKDDGDFKDLSGKIGDVSTQKIIVVLLKSDRVNELEQIELFFPNSKVVGLYPSKNSSKNMRLFTRHTKALETVREIISAAGFEPVLENLNSDEPF